jgi:chorismate dehydratase
LSALPSLEGLRIGAVSYLNTKPLIWALAANQVEREVPARLADRFYAGELDVALLPIFEVLHHGGGSVADQVAIACDGAVFSVLVASRTEFAECGEIFLDPSSRTSAALLRVLIAEWHPHLTVRDGTPPPDAARLLIGDPAIRFQFERRGDWRCQDLGALWKEHTGLPFVFAVWALRPGLRNPGAVADALRAGKVAGLADRARIAADQEDSAFALDYLTRFIRYDIGGPERAAITLFARLAARHGLLAGAVQPTFL